MTVIELVTTLTEMMEDDNNVANMQVLVPEEFGRYYDIVPVEDIDITDEGQVRLS